MPGSDPPTGDDQRLHRKDTSMTHWAGMAFVTLGPIVIIGGMFVLWWMQ